MLGTDVTDLRENLVRLMERIGDAERRAGRPEGFVRLVAVTKTLPAARVDEAIAAGVDAIGENRVKEAHDKRPRVSSSAEWHLIGHLQTNKVHRALATFDVIESIDSERLAREVGVRAGEIGRRVPVMVEVNVSGEAAKTGVAPEGLDALLDAAAALPALDVRGLMALGPLTGDERAVRAAFARLRSLGEAAASRGRFGGRAGAFDLSMGMSDDFEAAILEGSTIVRIGRALFGPRAPARG
jgi:hypothetical protein